MDNMLIVSPSPHIRSKRSTCEIMGNVLIALAPAVIVSFIYYGLKAIVLVLASNLFCGLFEYLFCLITKKKQTVKDLSCFVSGTLLALSLPASMGEFRSLWMLAIGCFVAIIVVKELFGGIGYNFANPAIVARIVLLLCFDNASGGIAPTFVDSVSTATPLASVANGNAVPSNLDMLLGLRSGAIGESCIIALVAGGIYLIIRRIISWHTPVAFIATVALFSLILGYDPLFAMMAGGVVLGAFFMATDYTTSPDMPLGKIIFGFGCGFITVVIRKFGALPEGVSYAILLMNILNPYICKLTKRKIFGGAKK